jgi:FkbM family methyltransferase
LRHARPDELVIEAAVTTARGPINFFEIPNTGLSTGIANIAASHQKAGWKNRKILVPTVTLEGLFESFGKGLVHWLKVDVEGMEADVIASWGDHPARPPVLVIEATAPNTQIQTHEAWYELVLSKGYIEVVFDGLSRYFVHQDWTHLGDKLAESPNIFDQFYISATHFSSGYLISENERTVSETRARLEERLEAERSEASKQIASHEADRLALTTRLAEIEDALQIANKGLADKEANLTAANKRIATLEAAGEKCAELEQLLLSAGEREKDLIATVKGKDTELDRLTRELTEAAAELQKQQKAAAEENSRHEQAHASARAALAAANERGAELEQLLLSAGEHKKDLIATVKGKDTELDRLRTQLAEAIAAVEEHSSRSELLASQLIAIESGQAQQEEEFANRWDAMIRRIR